MKERISWKYIVPLKILVLIFIIIMVSMSVFIVSQEIFQLEESSLMKFIKLGTIILALLFSVLFICFILLRDADLVEMDSSFIYVQYKWKAPLQFPISDLLEVRTHAFSKPPRPITLIFKTLSGSPQKVKFYPEGAMSLEVEGPIVKKLRALKS